MAEIPHLNIDELYETKQKIDLQRVNIYNKLLKQVHNKIKTASRQRVQNEFCYFVMPEVLIGFPNYNFEECLFYIIDCLETDGFITKYVHPNLILITWKHWIPLYVREQYKQKTGNEIDKFGNIINKKNDSLKDNIHNKKVSFKDDKKNINKTYKPSGKFVYGNEILESIREIL